MTSRNAIDSSYDDIDIHTHIYVYVHTCTRNHQSNVPRGENIIEIPLVVDSQFYVYSWQLLHSICNIYTLVIDFSIFAMQTLEVYEFGYIDVHLSKGKNEQICCYI